MPRQLTALFTFLLLLSVTFTSCRKYTTIPRATTEGKNTFGCTINGKIFVPRQGVFVAGIKSSYYVYDGAGYFSMSAAGPSDSNDWSVSISTDSLAFITGSTYKLQERASGNATGRYMGMLGNQLYDAETTTREIGEIHLTLVDTTKRIIAGSFWFDVRSPDSAFVQIRNGKFDVRY